MKNLLFLSLLSIFSFHVQAEVCNRVLESQCNSSYEKGVQVQFVFVGQSTEATCLAESASIKKQAIAGLTNVMTRSGLCNSGFGNFSYGLRNSAEDVIAEVDQKYSKCINAHDHRAYSNGTYCQNYNLQTIEIQ